MFKKLPYEMKELVVRGVYSVFELKVPYEGYNFILIKSDDSGILLNEEGLRPKVITSLANIELGKVITINDVSVTDSVVVNNIA